jgi:predicted metalloprotease with PDZ domain
MLHEVMHSFMRARAGEDGDWVVEGLAELYSVSLLRRSGTLSERRYESALDGLRARARDAGPLRAPSVDGDTRAQAAIVLLELDEMIREATTGERNLDHVVRRLARQREAITTDLFQRLAQEEAGRDLQAFFDRHAPPPKKAR